MDTCILCPIYYDAVHTELRTLVPPARKVGTCLPRVGLVPQQAGRGLPPVAVASGTCCLPWLPSALLPVLPWRNKQARNPGHSTRVKINNIAVWRYQYFYFQYYSSMLGRTCLMDAVLPDHLSTTSARRPTNMVQVPNGYAALELSTTKSTRFFL